MLKSIEEAYYIVDEIAQRGVKSKKKGRKGKLSLSEVITILIEGHKRHLQTEKQLFALVNGELRVLQENPLLCPVHKGGTKYNALPRPHD